MKENKKIYKEPVYRIIKVRNKLSLLAGTLGPAEEPGSDPAGQNDPARQNDMEDTDDF